MDEQVDTISTEVQTEPTVPGFYRYSGGNQIMIFLLTSQGNWFVILDNGTMDRCVWEYIEQALGVWTLVRIESDE